MRLDFPQAIVDGVEQLRNRLKPTQDSSTSDQTLGGTNTPNYVYDKLHHPLQETRLLILLPSRNKFADLRCKLEVACLSNNYRKYDAMSYVWGDQQQIKPLFIEGRVLFITQNLADCLQQLRNPSQPRRLWTDAVVINQNNDEEKTQQVLQMHSIYAKASRVLIWLGTSDLEMDQAMDFLKTSRALRNWSKASQRLAKQKLPIAGLSKIFHSPWWFRMWVVQEVVAATKDPVVICGNRMVSWEIIRMALGYFGTAQRLGFASKHVKSILASENADQAILFATITGKTRRGHQNHEKNPRSLNDWLNVTVQRKASDPRDHVYALLGLLVEHEMVIRPDYTMPVGKVYQTAIFYCFCSQGNLDWLIFANTKSHRGYDSGLQLPSWCVNFSICDWNSDYRRLWSGDLKRGLPKHRFEDSFIRMDLERGVLKVSGQQLGMIDSFGKVFDAFRTDAQSSIEVSLQLLAFSETAFKALKKRFGHDEAASRIAKGHVWQVASGGIENLLERCDPTLFKDLRLPQPSSTYAIVQKVVEEHFFTEDLPFPWSHLLPDLPPEGDSGTLATLICELVARVAGNSFLFTTTTGEIGLAGCQLEQGDILYSVLGCHFPMILRPSDDAGRFQYVTYTYTYEHDFSRFWADEIIMKAEGLEIY